MKHDYARIISTCTSAFMNIKTTLVILVLVIGFTTVLTDNCLYAQSNTLTGYGNATSGFLLPGDILFQDLDCGPLCEAIEAVTEGVNGKDFSHCGMVVEVDGSLQVVEAISKGGVVLTPVEQFIARSGAENITHTRLKPAHRYALPMATAFAIDQVGMPYDEEYILKNGRFYCSELLYESFKMANKNKDFFQLYPMTYKQPRSQDFFPAWEAYYEKLDKPIPEGKPGLNPGSISRSDKLMVIR